MSEKKYKNYPKGRVSIFPDKAQAGTWEEWKIKFTAGTKSVRQGGGWRIIIYGREVWPMFQTEYPDKGTLPLSADTSLLDENGKPVYGIKEEPCCYITASCPEGISLKLVPKNNYMYRQFTAILSGRDLSPGETVIFCLGDRSAGGPGCLTPIHAHRKRFIIYIDFEGRGNFVQYGDPVFIDVKPAPAVAFRIYIPSTPRNKKHFDITIRAIDKYGNTATDFAGTVNLKVEGKGIKLPDKIEICKEDNGIKIFKGEITGKGVARVVGKCGELEGVSNPIDCTGKTGNLNLFWGDLHGQTMLAAGMETPDYYFKYARDEEKLDFAALANNDAVMIDRINYDLPLQPFWENERTAWTIVKYDTMRYNNPGNFITFLCYEWTSLQSKSPGDRPYGHKNIYFVDDVGAFYSHSRPESDTPDKLWNLLKDKNALTIPHHMSYPLDKFITGTDWKFHNPDMQKLVEIYSKQGTSEYRDNPKPVCRTDKTSSYAQDALSLGYRVGFVGGSDTHISRPGSIMKEFGKNFPYPESGLTGVWAEELTRESIFEALRQRHCYATMGHRIILYVELNGAIMGDEITAKEGEKLVLKVRVEGTEIIEQIAVIKNNKEIYLHKGISYSEKFEFRDTKSSREVDFYYVRVIQKGEIYAWSSPIWVVKNKDNHRDGQKI